MQNQNALRIEHELIQLIASKKRNECLLVDTELGIESSIAFVWIEHFYGFAYMPVPKFSQFLIILLLNSPENVSKQTI